MVYNKTLNTKDYEHLKCQEASINYTRYLLGNARHSFEHKHRMWEYGMVLKAAQEVWEGHSNMQTLLDVGGGASIFAPTCALAGMSVLQVDKENRADWVQEQNDKFPPLEYANIKYVKEDFFNFGHYGKFDVVTAISVLEHVELDGVFFNKLLSFVNPMGLIGVTVDFHPDARRFVKEHLRTYNEHKLRAFIEIARGRGFTELGEDSEYSWRGPDVNEYTFASIIMRKTYGA